MLFLTTFLWLSCSHALETPQLPRENLGNPAISPFSGVPHSGPNTLFVAFVLSCEPQDDQSRTRKHFRNRHATYKKLDRIYNQCIAMWNRHIGRPTPSPFSVPDAWYWSSLGPIPTRYRQSTGRAGKQRSHLNTEISSVTPYASLIPCTFPFSVCFVLCAIITTARRPAGVSILYPTRSPYNGLRKRWRLFRPPTHQSCSLLSEVQYMSPD